MREYGADIERPRPAVQTLICRGLDRHLEATLDAPSHSRMPSARPCLDRRCRLMRVIRTMPDEGWVPLANIAVRDHKLSWRARGLLAELLSYPDGWRTTVDELVKLGQLAGGHAEGRDAMRTAMNELVQAGYVVRRKVQGERGKFISTFEVADDPAAHRPTEYPASVGQFLVNQRTVDQAQDSQSVINKTVTNMVTKTDLQKRSNEHSTSLASLATAADAAAEFEINKPTLDEHYELVNKMPTDVRRRALLELEKRRPKIYREARRNAMAQYKKEGRGVLQGPHAHAQVDRLSYQYAIQHYFPDVPPWLAKPMGLTAYA